MTRRRLGWGLAVVVLAALAWWVIDRTYWADVSVWTPLKGEARTNPFYAAERFVETLGAHGSLDRMFTPPSSDAIVVLTAFNWGLSDTRRVAIERWVESGGRLVVDTSLVGASRAFERWTGVVRAHRELPATDESEALQTFETFESCRSFTAVREGASGAQTFVLCGSDAYSSLTSRGPVVWRLEGSTGVQAIRVRVGRGRVTVINAVPFQYMGLMTGDHGRLFVEAAELRRGDIVHFLTESDHPSLLGLVWQHGAPAAGLALTAVALLLWRGGVRFGPLEAPPSTARRSLAEQVRGSGRFALRHGGGDALHAACVRALHEAARRRVTGYDRLSATERLATVARLTGLDRVLIAAAVHHPRARRPGQLHGTMALLEEARRRLLPVHTRSLHGTA